MVTQQELREKIQRLESMNGQLETYEQQIEFVNQKIQGHNQAKNIMEKYEDREEGKELLVPIGGDAHLHTKVSDQDTVVVELGAEVSAERPVGDAVDIVEERKSEFQDSKDEMQEDYSELKQQAQELEQEVRKEYQQLQGQGQPGQGQS